MGSGRVKMYFLSSQAFLLVSILVLCPVSSYELPKNPEFQFVTTDRTQDESPNIFREQVKEFKGETSSNENTSENTVKGDGASARSFYVGGYPQHNSPDFERGPNSNSNLNPPQKFKNFDSNPSFNKYLNFDSEVNTPDFGGNLKYPPSESMPKFSGVDASRNQMDFERNSRQNQKFQRPSNFERNQIFERQSNNFERNQNFDRQSINFVNSNRNQNSVNSNGNQNSGNFNGSPNFDGAPNPQNFDRPGNFGRGPNFKQNLKPSNFDPRPNSGMNPNFDRSANFGRKPNFDGNFNSGGDPNFDQTAESTRNQESNFYSHPKAKVNRQLKFEPNEDDRDFRGNNNQIEDSPDWSGGGGKNPKTFPMPSLPTLDIIEDPEYDHNRPKWPLNEYLSDKFNSFYRPNFFGGSRSNKTHEANKQYEWQQLKPLSNSYSGSLGGSSSFDRHKYFHLDDNEAIRDSFRHGHNSQLQSHHRYADSTRETHHPSTNGHSTTVSTMTDVKPSASETAERGKYGYSSSYGQPHYFPPDHYPKKRFRLSIHPGYIAAPIAGLAAFGAASALTKKPLLFELGLVNNKHHYAQNYPHQGGVHYPGHGWASTVMPVVPGGNHINPPIITSGHSGVGPTFPVLKPEASQLLHGHHLHHHHHSYPNQHHGHHHGHHHGNHHHGNHHHAHGHHHSHQTPEHTKKPWWNPFAALTPRD